MEQDVDIGRRQLLTLATAATGAIGVVFAATPFIASWEPNARAKALGALREDFVGEDLVLLLIATATIMHITRADAPDAWRRFVALALDAFAHQGAPRLPEPPSTAQMTRAMIRLARERGCAGRG